MMKHSDMDVGSVQVNISYMFSSNLFCDVSQ